MPIRKQRGGGTGYLPGIPVNNIETFLPTSIPDIALWIKAEGKFLKEETVQSYSNKQSYFIKEKLIEQFGNSLNTRVITEIVSDTPNSPNSLIPLNIDTSLLTVFPTLREINNELDAINISNYKEPVTGKIHKIQLITKRPVSINESSSVYSISHGVKITQNMITNQIMTSVEIVEQPVVNPNPDIKYISESHPNYNPLEASIIPTAEISEIILYSRTLTPDENAKLEGYLAYKQNTQYVLPAGHPYLPNMISDPIFDSYAQEFKRIRDELRQEISYINVAVKDYINERGDNGIGATGSKYRDEITNYLNLIDNIIHTLSKGYLYAKRINKLTIDTIFKAIQDQSWSSEGISETGLIDFINKSKNIISRTNHFIESLRSTHSQQFVPQSGGSREVTVQITDHVQYTEQLEKSKVLYTNLRERQKQIEVDGMSSYIRLQNKLKEDLSIYIDTIFHQWSDIQTKNTALERALKDVESFMTNDLWLKYLPTVDKGKNNEMRYNDESLELINGYYKHVKGNLVVGDYAYIFEEFKHLKDLFSRFRSYTLNPVFRTTYTNFLKRNVKKGDEFYKQYLKIHETFTKYLENVNSFITVAKDTGQTSTYPEVIDSASHFRPLISDIYLRKVVPIDTELFGLEYVETTADGFLIDTNVIPFFQDFTPINLKTTKILDEGGKNIIQRIHILSPLNESVYKGLSSDEKPSLYHNSVQSLFEINRNEMNAIHCIEVSSPINPILLPSHVITKDSWILIYNTGEIPFAIRTPENMVNIIGPNNGILYTYINEETQYSSYNWTRNQIAYDSLLDHPRTNLSMHIDELGTSVYIREYLNDMYEPVYTLDGYLCEVNKASDNYVYDIDDIYKSNPYIITNVSMDKRVKLILNPKMKKMVKIAPTRFKICQEKVSGFALLLNERGHICMNEFGYVKAIRAPIQKIGDNYKIRGAYGDINLEPTFDLFKSPYDIEPFLNFEFIFTTRFASSAGNKYVFVTNSLYPIVGPNGVIVEVPPIINAIPTFYNDETGQHEVLVVKSLNIFLDSKLYKRPIEFDYSFLERVRLKFKNSKDYIMNEIKTVEEVAKDIREFDDETGEFFKDAIELFKKSLQMLETNNSIIESDKYPTPQAFDAVDESIKTSLDKFQTTKDDVYLNIKAYKDGIDEIKLVKDTVKFWNTDGVKEIDDVVNDINTKVNDVMMKHKTTFIDILDKIVKESIDLRTVFNDTLTTCVNYVLTPPSLISEVHSWHLYIKPKLEQLKSVYENAKLLRSLKLVKAIKTLEINNIYTTNTTKIQELFKEVQTIWSSIHDNKIAIDTYMKMNPTKVSSEEYDAYENKILDGDAKISSLYKQIKSEPPSEKLYMNIQKIKGEIMLIKSIAPKIYT